MKTFTNWEKVRIWNQVWERERERERERRGNETSDKEGDIDR